MKINVKSPAFIFSLIIIFYTAYITTILISIWPIDSVTLGQAGVFGDSFGILTSLFSAFAFGGLIITIWQQQEELRQNREEIRTQHFENILFRMLEVHTSILQGLDIRNGNSHNIIAAGRDCFEEWHRYLRKNHNDLADQDLSTEEKLHEAYKKFWQVWNKDLGHYFRFLYNIFKHIHNSEMKNKKTYANIVRAQLSDNELIMILYNCISPYGMEKFKPLCEEYSLFDNLPLKLLIAPEHKDLFTPKAFATPTNDPT